MNTPIYDFVAAYADRNAVRAHMPGHKGIGCGDLLSSVYPLDITEIGGADALFEADGIIAESEKNASSLFGTHGTFYSAGGSTLCIQAMLAMVCKEGDTVAAARNSHKAMINACILLGLDVEWIYPAFDGSSVISGEITASQTERALCAKKKPACVYITSTDYLGKTADIKAIAAVCRRHGVPLLVDNAHGAHLAFLDVSEHPIALGADICCDSAHKTLPVLTGGAYLHTASAKYSALAKNAMSLFGSSSPSYLILQSLDLCNRYLDGAFRDDLRTAVRRMEELKEKLSDRYSIYKSEPLKLSVFALPCGKTGYELSDYLRSKNIEAEYADSASVMLMFSASSRESDYERVYEALRTMPFPKIRLEPMPLAVAHPKKAMSPRAAYFSENENIPTECCEGRICCKTRTVCPPCVPVAVSGEIFDAECIKILKMYSIMQVNVLK